MESSYEVRTPSWAWAAIPVAVVLVLTVLWAVAAHGPRREAVASAALEIASPVAARPLAAVRLPAAFEYQGKHWTRTEDAVTSRDTALRDIGLTVARNIVYARLDARPPYSTLYTETRPGSERFVAYRNAGTR